MADQCKSRPSKRHSLFSLNWVYLNAFFIGLSGPEALGGKIAAISSYSCWFVTVYGGEEIKCHERDLRLPLILCPPIVMLLYVLLDTVYRNALPLGGLIGIAMTPSGLPLYFLILRRKEVLNVAR